MGDELVFDVFDKSTVRRGRKPDWRDFKSKRRKERTLFGESFAQNFALRKRIGTEWIADSITIKDDVYFLSKQT